MQVRKRPTRPLNRDRLYGACAVDGRMSEREHLWSNFKREIQQTKIEKELWDLTNLKSSVSCKQVAS